MRAELPRVMPQNVDASILRRVIAALRHFRFTPFDISTAAGRDAERYRLAALGLMSSVLSRAASVALVIVGVKLTVPYLGAERFGVWATFASMAAMLSILDLGVGNAIVNRVAIASASDNRARLRDAVTGGSGVLVLFALASVALLLTLATFVPWDRLFHLTSNEVAAEARTAAHIFAVLFGINLVGSGLLKALVGQQKSFESNLITMIGSALACGAVAACANLQGSVSWLLLASFGVQALTSLSAVVLLARRGLLVAKDVFGSARREGSALIRSGALFLLLQIGTMIGWGSDSLLIAGLLGAKHVAVFAIAQRLFQFASMPLAMVNAPLWAAYADASARGDRTFIARTLRVSMKLTFSLALVFILVILALAPRVLGWWTDGSVLVPWSVLALFAVWTLLEVSGNAFAMYLNGCGVIRQQVWVVGAFCVIALPLKVALATTHGVAGLLAGTIVAYAVAVVLPYGTVFRRDIAAPIAR